MTNKTLRDEFAMAALSGMIINPIVRPAPEDIANLAYQLADAMLAERNKTKGE